LAKYFRDATESVLQFLQLKQGVSWGVLMKSTRERWRGKYDFLLIAHEHLYIFRKPEKDEKISQFKESMRWA